MPTINTRIPGVRIARRIRNRLRSAAAHDAIASAGARRSVEPKSHTVEIRVRHGELYEPALATGDNGMRTLRCEQGEIYCVAVDLRRDSPTFAGWVGLKLNSGDDSVLKIPPGVAVGWIATGSRARLKISRLKSKYKHTNHEPRLRSLRWNDRSVAIDWPCHPTKVLSSGKRSRLSRIAAELVCDSRSSDRQPATQPTSKHSAPQPTLQASLAKVDACSNSRPLILVIGSSGQLGTDLCRHLRQVGTVIGACRNPVRLAVLPVPMEIDISRPASLRQAIRQVRPNLIVNAAGLTDVDRCEAEPRLAQLINAIAPAVMAEEAARCGAALVHFCTDMVFAGHGERPWRECDTPEPLCQYARTKWIGTEAIRSSGVAHLVLRSGWLYSTHGENYVRQIMHMSLYRSSLSQAEDHYGSPTSTDWLAATTARILSTTFSQKSATLAERGGLFHCASLGFASRAEVAELILAECRQQRMPVVTRQIHSAPLADLPSLAQRPANCRLDCSRLAMEFQIELPRWQEQLSDQIDRMVGDIRVSSRAVA